MTPITQRDDDDQPYFQTKPMSPFTRALFGLGVAHMRSVEATVRDVRGSAEALADCRKRLKDAQRTAQLIELYGACPCCNTPYIGEDEPCIKCDPSTENEPGGIY